MTEGGLSCILVAHEHPEKLHTVGRPAPGNLLKVLGENFQEVAPGEIGELVGKSSVVMLGYKNRPDQSSENYWIDPRDGSTWLRTGDVVRTYGDGFVVLFGRSTDRRFKGRIGKAS